MSSLPHFARKYDHNQLPMPFLLFGGVGAFFWGGGAVDLIYCNDCTKCTEPSFQYAESCKWVLDPSLPRAVMSFPEIDANFLNGFLILGKWRSHFRELNLDDER